MVIIPLVIATICIGLTLCYACWRDIIERRVPHRTWHLPIIISFVTALWFYGGFMLGLTGPDMIGYLFTAFICLFLLTALDISLTCRSSEEPCTREDYLASVMFMMVFTPAGAAVVQGITTGKLPVSYAIAIIALTFCLVFYIFHRMNLFGGADAYALMIISAFIPVYPIIPLAGYPAIPIFPLSVLLNASLLALLAPVCLFAYNVAKGNRAPLPYLFLGYPVAGDRISDAFGIVMEEIELQDGRLVRKFIGIGDSLGRMVKGKNRIYTKDLKVHPDQYHAELAMYRRAGKVWISYGIPFMIPITAGIIIAAVIGDLFYGIVTWLTGVIL